MHSQSKRPHTHDVRTLCMVSLPDEDPVLVSGGNDAQLLVHSVPRYIQVRTALDVVLFSNSALSQCCLACPSGHSMTFESDA